jgi:hypothetical protein
MTYYEWITYIDNLKHNAVTEEMINNINNATITYTGDIKVRFLNHIVDVINYRLNEALDNFYMKLHIIAQDRENLMLEINYLKNEMVIAKKLATVKHFDDNTKKSLLDNIYKLGSDMNNQIKEAFANSSDQGVLVIINNLDLNS